MTVEERMRSLGLDPDNQMAGWLNFRCIRYVAGAQ